MKKNMVLGLINVLLAVFFIFILLKSSYVPLPENLFMLFKTYWFNMAILALSIGNLIIIYKLFIKKDTGNFLFYSLLTGFIVFFFIMIFSIGIADSSSAPPAGFIPSPDNSSLK